MFDIAGNKIGVFFGNSYFIEHNVFRVRKVNACCGYPIYIKPSTIIAFKTVSIRSGER